MAQKKYVSLDKLSLYDEKIKALIKSNDTTTLDSAKKYADGLADNYEAAGSVNTAKEELQGNIDTVFNKVTTAQNEVDALETLVGTLPEDSGATSVVDYVNKKTTGIATDATVAALSNRVTQAETDIDNIEKDYLKAADKTELEDTIGTISGKVNTLIGTDADKSVRTIANEELAAQLIPENADESLNTLQEIAAWIQDHPDDASAMNQAITALQNKVGTIPTEGVTATNIVDYIQELVNAEESRATGAEDALGARLTTLESNVGTGGTVENKIATAKQEAIDAAATDASNKDTALETKITAAYKKYADDEDAKIETRVSTLEDAAATHAKVSDLTALTTRVTTAEGNITKLQSDVNTISDNVTANTNAINSFVEVTTEEINALFTA